MIRLKEPGERGGYLLVELTPFDILSLQEGLSMAVAHLADRKESDPEAWEILGWEAKLRDAHANFKELERVLEDREKLLSSFPKVAQ